jgi:hypothetical protein
METTGKHGLTREGKSQNAKGKSQNDLLHFAFCLLTSSVFIGGSSPEL